MDCLFVFCNIDNDRFHIVKCVAEAKERVVAAEDEETAESADEESAAETEGASSDAEAGANAAETEGASSDAEAGANAAGASSAAEAGANAAETGGASSAAEAGAAMQVTRSSVSDSTPQQRGDENDISAGTIGAESIVASAATIGAVGESAVVVADEGPLRYLYMGKCGGVGTR